MQAKTGKTHKAKAADASSYNYELLYTFCSVGGANCTDGKWPSAGLIQDAAGNLYGTTSEGGANGGGTVFKVDSAGTETVLYSFCSVANCTDGVMPFAGLIHDAAGNLYGTTWFGGANFTANSNYGGGTVFKVDSTGKETVLYSFCSVGANCTDGADPFGLIQSTAGNLYGTTEGGGANNRGTVFKVDSTGHETVLYSFCSVVNANGVCTDGAFPFAGLIRDAAGNLYGTTNAGGVNNDGTVFKVDNTGKETVLYSFCSVLNANETCADGNSPFAGLIRDAAGNLYGTTDHGGAHSFAFSTGGTVFQVDSTGKETVLYSFLLLLMGTARTEMGPWLV